MIRELNSEFIQWSQYATSRSFKPMRKAFPTVQWSVDQDPFCQISTIVRILHVLESIVKGWWNVGLKGYSQNRKYPGRTIGMTYAVFGLRIAYTLLLLLGWNWAVWVGFLLHSWSKTLANICKNNRYLSWVSSWLWLVCGFDHSLILVKFVPEKKHKIQYISVVVIFFLNLEILGSP